MKAPAAFLFKETTKAKSWTSCQVVMPCLAGWVIFVQGRVVEIETVENLVVVVAGSFDGALGEELGVGSLEDKDWAVDRSEVGMDVWVVE